MKSNIFRQPSASSILAFAAILSFAYFPIYGAEYRSVTDNFRSLAMGGSGISSANDVDAIHFNPATLANVGTSIIDILSVEIDENEYGTKLRELIDVDKSSNQEKIILVEPNRVDYVSLVQEMADKTVYLRAKLQNAANISLDRKGWNIGLANTVDAHIRSTTGSLPDLTTDVEVEYNRIIIAGISIPVPFTMGAIVLGFSYKNVIRTLTKNQFNPGRILTDPNNALLGGVRTNDFIRTFDAGLMIRIPGPLRLRIAGVGRNLGGSRQVETYDEKKEFAVGISMVPVFNPSFYGGIRMTLAADYRDISEENTTKTDNDPIKRIHAGFELAFFPTAITYGFLSLRAGYSQGYPTYGAELNLGTGRTLILGYAHYSEEIGNNTTLIEDPRTVFYASIGLL